ncbi:MAG: alanine:cation symporter family protein [Desulfobulbaceae bacterium]|jgi:AGCS family alanine or glycine:cation symporter|nr:alanine:cation symporter family protein [Desulfobulbaceae bacterium]
MEQFFSLLNSYLWGWPMLILLIGSHLFLTVRTGFIQRYTWLGIKLSVTKDPDAAGDVSQFGALSTAMAATVGTGNIIGVGTAVALGGPGAVLWMWLTGVFGIATKYAESLVAVKYRVRTENGTMLGGAMFTLERGLHCRWAGMLFAACTALAAFGIGCFVQEKALIETVHANLGVPDWITGVVIAALVAVVILGGVKSIAVTCSALVPFMAFFYVIGCCIILFINGPYLIDTVEIIIKSAFNPDAAGGGFVGASIMMAARYGVARGLFSNESGMGSAPIVAAAARTRNPVRQALVSATGTFWDTVVICLLTGLVLVSTILADPSVSFDSAHGQFAGGSLLTTQAFGRIPVVGPFVLVVGLLTFAFSTILGWSYYGERGAEYLFGKKAIMPYRIIWVAALLAGSFVMSLGAVFEMADTLNALMAIPNLVAVLLLSGVVAKDTKYYLDGRIDEIDQTEIPVVKG